jgi:signal transduction histidine kinase
MNWKVGKVSLVSLSLVVVLFAVGAAGLLSVVELSDSWHWEKHTYEALGQSEKLLFATSEVETAGRGYLISGDQKFLEPFNTKLLQIKIHLRSLRQLTADNPRQQERLDRLEPLIQQRIAETSRVIAARASGDSMAAIHRVSTGVGKRLGDEIREIIGDLQSEENLLLADRDREVKAAVQRQQITMFGGSILAVSIVITSLALTTRELRQRRQVEREKRLLLEHLEEQVEQRTADLSMTNGRLSAEIVERKTTEQALQESSARLRKQARLLDLAHDGLKLSNETLEERVRERTAQAEAANRAKSAFLANMSHELRTPLNGIIGFAEFLADGKPGALNPKQKEYLEDILQSGRHLLQLIIDVLDLASVEAGKTELSVESFSLCEAIEDVCAVAKPLVEKKRIQMEVDIAPELGHITLDRRKFKQVVYNLLSNAIKFSDDGGKVQIIAAPQGEGRFKLSITDSGLGIKAEDLHRIFKKFEQLEGGASRRYEGTGLGLTLTEKIVELQGGTIRVESVVGKGSSFTVVLPLSIMASSHTEMCELHAQETDVIRKLLLVGETSDFGKKLVE